MRIKLLFLIIVAYVIYHILSGNRSVFVYFNKKAIIDRKIQYLEDIKTRTAEIENKINRLQDSSIDPDLLDEEARKILGQSESGDIVLIKQ